LGLLLRDGLDRGRACADADRLRSLSKDTAAKQEGKAVHKEGDIINPNFYSQLRHRLEEMEKSGSSPNHSFYVSTPASVAGPIIEGLGAVGLNRRDRGWTRIVLEKPFG
jgi:glucose-6-phosphate 1-dehydrogenase